MPPPDGGSAPPPDAAPPPPPPLRARLVAAAGASAASAVVVTPLDVVKTRLQAATTVAAAAAAAPAPVLTLAGAGAGAAGGARAAAVARGIVAAEGVRGLWRGTNYALLMSVPMVGVYMPLYDDALAFLQARGAGGAGGAALAGAAARAAAAVATAPLELARTRAQAPGGGLPPLPAPAGAGAAAAARAAWTGGAATLARDVPFSALYWGLLEPARSAVLAAWRQQPGDAPSAAAVAAANLFGGAAAGAAAAAATTPLDVVKTKVQLEAGSGRPTPGVWATLQDVASRRGVRGLFAGVGPRSARAAPACAIVVAAYELLKMAVGGGDVSGAEGRLGGLLEES